jgi:hypothetical protein
MGVTALVRANFVAKFSAPALLVAMLCSACGLSHFLDLLHTLQETLLAAINGLADGLFFFLQKCSNSWLGCDRVKVFDMQHRHKLFSLLDVLLSCGSIPNVDGNSAIGGDFQIQEFITILALQEHLDERNERHQSLLKSRLIVATVLVWI